jgi:RNA polymerase sigma-70 factor, ECF subfamily
MRWRGQLTDDRALWDLICRRDASAFDAFYQENAPRLRAFLRHVVGSRQVAEDIAQETFTCIWDRPHGFQPDRGSLRAYLYGIGRKRAAEWWRSQRPPEAIADINTAVCQAQILSIRDAFGQLPQEQRTLLWLREVDGQSYAELAAILEIPVGTVRSRLFAAREQLRKLWNSRRQGQKEGA